VPHAPLQLTCRICYVHLHWYCSCPALLDSLCARDCNAAHYSAQKLQAISIQLMMQHKQQPSTASATVSGSAAFNTTRGATKPHPCPKRKSKASMHCGWHTQVLSCKSPSKPATAAKRLPTLPVVPDCATQIPLHNAEHSLQCNYSCASDTTKYPNNLS
jgi:hypothetical protein